MTTRAALVLPLAVLAAACAELGEHDVVTVGRETLSLRDLRREYAELPPAERRGLATRPGRRAFVDATVDRKLLAAYGRELAREDPEALASLERQRAELLVRRLRTLEAGEQGVDPALRDEALARMAELHLAERAWFASREAAEAARAAAVRGAAFAQAAEDARGVAAESPEWMRWSPSPDPVSDAVSGTRPGEISEPVADAGRWVLVHVLERRAEPDTAGEAVADAVARGLRARRAAERVEAMTVRLREDAGLRVPDEGIALLVRRTAEAILDGNAGSLDREWAVPRPAPDEEDVTVAEWSGGRWTARDYAKEIERWIPLQRPQLHLAAEIRSAVDWMADQHIQVAEAERRGLEQEWWARRSLDRLEQARLVQLAVDRIDSSSPDLAEADSVAALLHSSQPELFRRETRARVLRIELTDPAVARAERDRVVAAGGGRARIQAILESEAAAVGTCRVLLLSRSEIGDPQVAATLFDGPAGVLAGPVELSGLWVLMETWALLPAHQLTAEEILVEVRQRMRRGDRAAVERWLAERREQVGVLVDEQALDQLAPGV